MGDSISFPTLAFHTKEIHSHLPHTCQMHNLRKARAVSTQVISMQRKPHISRDIANLQQGRPPQNSISTTPSTMYYEYERTEPTVHHRNNLVQGGGHLALPDPTHSFASPLPHNTRLTPAYSLYWSRIATQSYPDLALLNLFVYPTFQLSSHPTLCILLTSSSHPAGYSDTRLVLRVSVDGPVNIYR